MKKFSVYISEREDPDIGHRKGSQPAGYHKGIKSVSTKIARDRHFKKYADKDDNNPKNYKPAPGDATAKTKPSKYTKKYDQMFGEESLIENKKGLQKKAKETGISYSILKKVFDRGVAAWKSGHRPGTTPSQWGFARVNSFATGGKTRTTADADLWKQHRKESFEEVLAANELFNEAVLKVKRRDAEVILLDALKKYLRDATPNDLKNVGDMIGKKITISMPGPKGMVMIGEAGAKSWIMNRLKKEGGAGEWGTPELTRRLKKDTPGENV